MTNTTNRHHLLLCLLLVNIMFIIAHEESLSYGFLAAFAFFGTRFLS